MYDKKELILEYYNKVKNSNKELTKKEAFKDLLNRLYAEDTEIKKIIDKITLGSEKTIVNIPRKDKLHIGSADTLYNNIIIEFENDLNKSYKHAKEQLAGYLLGQFRSGEGYHYTLIASDFINWKVLAPDINCIDKLDTLQEHELILNEIESASFQLNESNAEEFYYWIDRFLFKEEKQKATLQTIEEAFGYQSSVFIESYRLLNNYFYEAKRFGVVQVSYEQWHKFLSIAYGTFDARDDIFLIHTYLSIFSKMLAYAVLSNDDFIDDDEMHKILDGSIFYSFNISNFVENDFFHWVNDELIYHKLKNVFRIIAQEISNFDFNNVSEDILKGVYQELIDIDTRHTLGEYYTPDWLCEKIVEEFDFKKTDKILDPSCGSGSFLRAFIHRFKKLYPDFSAEDISNQVYGIDIHPLSVQIAKTTMLLALGKDISKAHKPIHLNVILANTLLAPEGIENNLFGNEFIVQIDKDKIGINNDVLNDVVVFDAALDICDKLSGQTIYQKNIVFNDFVNIINKQINVQLNKQSIQSFYNIYREFKKVKESKRDSIWKFILSNLYKPYFLSNKFDYVIGNPPWFTYSSIKNIEYQNILNELAIKYDVKPKKVANFPHLEIAAIFLSHCSSYFLHENGKLAFVMPRSLLSADHHENSRNGTAKGFRLNKIWDFNDVTPLFRVPSCVLFAEKAENNRKISPDGIGGAKFSGKLPSHNCNYEIAKNILVENSVTWYFVQQGGSSAFTTQKNNLQNKVNPYKNLFKNGATIVPRAFYFIEIKQEIPDDFKDRIINIVTSEAALADAKDPWKIKLEGLIESQFLFRTAISKSILPFCLYNPDLIILPIIINVNDRNEKVIELHNSDSLRSLGYINAAAWFQNAERIWDISKTDRNKNISAEKYLNWMNKLTNQDLNSKYIVLYNASAKDANSLVIDRQKLDLEFIADGKEYIYYTNNLYEANYLSAILNSTITNFLIKDFQTKGLFGARDIHKRILDIYFPKYDEKNYLHKLLSDLGKQCHDKVEKFIKSQSLPQNLSMHALARLRLEIKKHLENEMRQIDELVEKIMKEE